MYGYFKPRSSHFNSRESHLFSAYYCRTCYCLRLAGGQTARFFTTFDMAVYAVILNMFQKKEQPARHRCERYLTRTLHTFDNDTVGRRLANMSIILFGEKIHDDFQDRNYLRGGAMSLIYKRTVEKARRSEPDMARTARIMTDTIAEMQNSGAELFDILEYYGKCIADLFSCIDSIDDNTKEAIEAVAEWTFYMDMLTDYDDDVIKGAYNGLKLDGCPTLRRRFDTDCMGLIAINRKVSHRLRQAVLALYNQSCEWSVLYKITDYALKNAGKNAFLSPSERYGMMIKGRCNNLRTRFESIFIR